MSFKSAVGLDFFDFAIHVGVTAMLMVVVDAASNSPDDTSAIAAVVAVSLVVLAWRRQRAIRRGETAPRESPSGEYTSERVADLEQRVADLESHQGRMLELEERLDFTERLLTQQREGARQLGVPRQEA